jgi:hypothetical protein
VTSGKRSWIGLRTFLGFSDFQELQDVHVAFGKSSASCSFLNKGMLIVE